MWDTGDSDGEWNLGVAYESGKFGKVDAVKALKHYQKAADGDDANALGRLGYAYELEVDGAKALEYYTKAAEGGDTYAQYSLDHPICNLSEFG